MKKIIYLLSSAVLLLTACKKTEFQDNTPTGEGLVDFTLTGPTSGNKVLLNAATPSAPVVFSWNAARPGLITNPTYKVVMAQRTGGSLTTPLMEFPVPAGATTLSLTHQQLDDALKAKSIGDGATADLIWSVRANNTSVTIISTSVFFITITRMKDGASPFVLLGPVPTITPMEINPVSTTDQIKFNWTRSKPATGGPAISYRVLFAERKLDANGNEVAIDWNAPLFSIASNTSGADSLLTVTTKQISDSLALHGFSDLSAQANLKWTVVATSGTWKQLAEYKNNIFILRQIKFYIVGNFTGWDINNPWEIITDKKADRFGKVFYGYVKLSAGDAFKFFKTKGDWGSGYGNNGGGAGGEYNTGFNVGSDFSITTSGIYRLTVDVANNKAYIQQKQVGIVGQMQGWNPASPTYGGYVNRNQFLIVTNATASDEFKLHDGSAGAAWTFGVKDDRWWGDLGGGVLDYDGNGPNTLAGASRIRLIWDGRNGQQVKYEKSPATEMRIVGNGMQGVAEWNPGASPQMTYSGNGIWTLTLNLIGNKEIKFLAGNDWGAFDYEDNSGGSQATGTPRGIKWEGGDNFKTPVASGSYTITLNEHTQTVTIN